ncbi:MAG: HdeA/HdeB family chaperone, partial [Methyloceanibacter sp.]
LGASPALAADQKIDLTKITCAHFAQYDDENKGTIMMWFEGYYTEEDEPATIDFAKMAAHLTKMLIDCEANPDKNVLEVAEEAMPDD